VPPVVIVKYAGDVTVLVAGSWWQKSVIFFVWVSG
jgi:hypothetical protein